MTNKIGSAPFWQLTFDAEGDPGDDASKAIDEIVDQGITDLVVFSHGWNNSQEIAGRLYKGWFGQMASQLSKATDTREVKVGFVGVFWPAQRWSDEPIPDFEPPSGAARSGDAAAAGRRTEGHVVSKKIDAKTLEGLRSNFPKGASQLDAMAALLAKDNPTEQDLADFMDHMKKFAKATKTGEDDGEHEAQSSDAGKTPSMLGGEPGKVFEEFAAELRNTGAVIETESSDAAGILDRVKDVWHGAKEALRQLTYWQMKNRAGVVGEKGLGPFLGRLNKEAPDLRVNLVGHSFGARVVSYALAGLPEGVDPTPVKSVTLLQGAFSHFAFSDPLPHDSDRKGSLAGKLSRIDGPLTVCFSEHDDAVGRFYPLASIASGVDSAAGEERFYRWGGMGHDGAQAVGAKLEDLKPAVATTKYAFEDGKALNIDASGIVNRGGPPSGAHSDIVHPELTWVVMSAGRIADRP